MTNHVSQKPIAVTQGDAAGIGPEIIAKAYLLQPELFQGRDCNVVVESASELTMGMTVVDWWAVSGRPANAMVMRTVDADGFFSLLTARLKTL